MDQPSIPPSPSFHLPVKATLKIALTHAIHLRPVGLPSFAYRLARRKQTSRSKSVNHFVNYLLRHHVNGNARGCTGASQWNAQDFSAFESRIPSRSSTAHDILLRIFCISIECTRIYLTLGCVIPFFFEQDSNWITLTQRNFRWLAV